MIISNNVCITIAWASSKYWLKKNTSGFGMKINHMKIVYTVVVPIFLLIKHLGIAIFADKH